MRIGDDQRRRRPPRREIAQQGFGVAPIFARHLVEPVEEQQQSTFPPQAVGSIYGGVAMEPQERALRTGLDCIVATPGRLIDHLERGNVAFDDLPLGGIYQFGGIPSNHPDIFGKEFLKELKLLYKLETLAACRRHDAGLRHYPRL